MIEASAGSGQSDRLMVVALTDVVEVVPLVPPLSPLALPDLGRPRDDERVADAAVVRGDALEVLEGCAEGVAPAVRYNQTSCELTGGLG